MINLNVLCNHSDCIDPNSIAMLLTVSVCVQFPISQFPVPTFRSTCVFVYMCVHVCGVHDISHLVMIKV